MCACKGFYQFSPLDQTVADPDGVKRTDFEKPSYLSLPYLVLILSVRDSKNRSALFAYAGSYVQFPCRIFLWSKNWKYFSLREVDDRVTTPDTWSSWAPRTIDPFMGNVKHKLTENSMPCHAIINSSAFNSLRNSLQKIKSNVPEETFHSSGSLKTARHLSLDIRYQRSYLFIINGTMCIPSKGESMIWSCSQKQKKLWLCTQSWC